MSKKVLYSAAFAAALVAAASAGEVSTTSASGGNNGGGNNGGGHGDGHGGLLGNLLDPLHDVFGHVVDKVTGLNPHSKWQLLCGHPEHLEDVEYGCDVSDLVRRGVLKPCFKNLFGHKGDNSLQDFINHDFSLDSISDTGFGLGCQFKCKPGSPKAIHTGGLSRSVFCVERDGDDYIVGCDGTLKGHFLEIVAKMKQKLLDKLDDAHAKKCRSLDVRCGEPTVLCPREGLSPEPGDVIPAWFSWHRRCVSPFLPAEECDTPICRRSELFCEDDAVFAPSAQVCVRELIFDPPCIPEIVGGYWIAEPEECDRCSPGIEAFPFEDCTSLASRYEASCSETGNVILERIRPPGSGGGSGCCPPGNGDNNNNNAGGCCKSERQTISIDEITATEDAIITINGGGASRPCDNNKPRNPIGSIIDHLNEIHDIKKDIKDSIL